MHCTTDGELTVFRFERLATEPGLAHAVVARPYNYAPHRGVGRENALAARRRVCELLGMPFDRLTSPSQVHGPEVLAVEAGDVGRGRDGRQTAVPFVDGLICDRPGVPLILLSADCPLVCVYDADRPAVGAVHASWRGTVAGAAENLVRQMVRVFGSDPGRLLAAVAPSGGPCCYEVGPEVQRIAEGRLDRSEECFRRHNGRLIFDLWAANRRQLINAGIGEDRIELPGLCSICDPRFWSHRRDGDEAGRFALFVGLCG